MWHMETPTQTTNLEDRIHIAHDNRYECKTWEIWTTTEKDWENKKRSVTWVGCREHRCEIAQ